MLLLFRLLTSAAAQLQGVAGSRLRFAQLFDLPKGWSCAVPCTLPRAGRRGMDSAPRWLPAPCANWRFLQAGQQCAYLRAGEVATIAKEVSNVPICRPLERIEHYLASACHDPEDRALGGAHEFDDGPHRLALLDQCVNGRWFPLMGTAREFVRMFRCGCGQIVCLLALCYGLPTALAPTTHRRTSFHALHADCLELTAPTAFKPSHPVRVT